MAPIEIVGRDAEVHTLDGFLAAPPPAVLLLEGAPGIGKTTVWRSGLPRARALGHRVLVARPLEAEGARALMGLADLVGDLFDEVGDALPPPQRRALAAALSRDDAADGEATAGAVSAGALGLLRAAARDGPVLLAIDDLQWLDASSRDVVRSLLRRLEDEPVRILATVRTGVPDLHIADDAQRLEVGPLDLDALAEIVAHELGRRLPRPAVRRLERMAGGNAFVALELARTMAADTDGEDALSAEQIRRLVGDRIETLPEATRDALAVVAALADPEVREVAAAVGDESLLDPAFDARILEEAAAQVRFTHPLLAAAAIGSLPPRRRRAMHARLAGIVADPEERARHLAASATEPSRAVAAALDEAAQRAARRGAPAAAAELCELAARLTPAADVETHGARLVRAGEHHEQTGDARRALALFRVAAAELPPGPGHARAAMFVGTHEHTPIIDGITLVEPAVLECGEDWHTRLECLLALTLALELTGRMREARERAGQVLAELQDDADPDLRLWALATVGQLDSRHTPGAGRDLLREAMRMEGDRLMPLSDLSPSVCMARLHVWADELDDARTLLGDVHARATSAGDEAGLADIEGHLALLECRAGHPAAARVHADACLAICDQGEERDQCFGGAMYPRAVVAAIEGDEDLARGLASRGLAIARTIGDRLYELSHLCALGFLELSCGDAEAALGHLGELPAQVASIGIGEPGLHPYHGDLLDALVASGRHAEAAAHAAAFEELGRRIDRPRLLCVSARARGLLAAQRGEHAAALAELDRALVLHDRLGDPLERGRTLLALGAVQRRAGRRREARETLGAALAVFGEIGAALWVRRTREELGRVSGRTAGARGDLTATERRVAELVATGRTNREVAAELFVTVRTVESNLTRVYSKLGVRSRAELASRRDGL